MRTQLFVPLVTYPDAIGEAIAKNAAAVAAELSGDLNVVAFNAHIPDVTNVWSRMLINIPQMILAVENESRQRGDALLSKFAEIADDLKIKLHTDRRTGAPDFLGELAAEESRYYDIALVGWEAQNQTLQATAEAVIFGSGRPTILLPDHSNPNAFNHVSIGWDGSRVAARAVADALPFLQKAASITVLTVTDEKPLKQKEAGPRLAQHLSRNGFSVEANAIMAEDCPIAITLQEHALDLHSDLLVMGGYGHSRVRDFVLGGATQGVLDDLRLPVLMSH